MEIIPEPIKPTPPAIELAGAAVGVNKQYVADAKKISEVAPEKFKEMQGFASVRILRRNSSLILLVSSTISLKSSTVTMKKKSRNGYSLQ